MPRDKKTTEAGEAVLVGVGYPLFQLAKALTTAGDHADPATRQRARQRVAEWIAVFEGMVTGTLMVGSRTPLAGVPAWATLKVVTGGFATGELLAAGPLEPHEQALLEQFPAAEAADARRVLNQYYLSEAGLAALQAALASGCYEVTVPEEGALLVVAWLLQQGDQDRARELLTILGPWFGHLRFYPIPTTRPRPLESRVFLQSVGDTVARLQTIKPNPRLLAQHEAITIWTPLYDQTVQLFLETVHGELPSLQCDADGQWQRGADGKFPVQGGWPCQHYPADWTDRADALLAEYDALRAIHKYCRRPDRAKDSFAQLRSYLQRSIADPTALTARDVGRIRLILARYLTKHGPPAAPQRQAVRAQQAKQVAAPTFQQIATYIIARLQLFPQTQGLDDLTPVTQPLTAAEATQWQLPAETLLPPSLQRKVERALQAPIDVLVERGLVTSGEVVARLLPQVTAEISSIGFTDPHLRRLYVAIYAAFRRRRSLLLLNLAQQIQFEELPWVAALEPLRHQGQATQAVARQTLIEVTDVTVTAFPHTILPNKLLQELRMLTQSAALDLPLVDEIAADIFMGEFSSKFLEAAKRAGTLLENTLYATYYGIDYAAIRALPSAPPAKQSWFKSTTHSPFVKLCAKRADVVLGTWDPATNGMIIEQQQILTTQNLAVLFAELQLSDLLQPQLAELAQRCFQWICRHQQLKTDHWHAQLIQLKKSAYAWRQLIFFLAVLPSPAVAEFLGWAEAYLDQQPEPFRSRFRPALTGLQLAAQGQTPERVGAAKEEARRLLGWSKQRHWLLGESLTQN